MRFLALKKFKQGLVAHDTLYESILHTGNVHRLAFASEKKKHVCLEVFGI